MARKNMSFCGLPNTSMFEVESDAEIDIAYSRYVASTYLAAMYKKRYQELTKAALEELSHTALELTDEMSKKSKLKSRVHQVLGILENTQGCTEEEIASSSAVDTCNSGLVAVEKLITCLEASVNQLTLGDGFIISEDDAGKLDSLLEKLAINLSHCREGLTSEEENWMKFAHITQDLSQSDLLLQKKRCDELLKKLNEVILKLSSLRAAKIASECSRI